MPNDSQINDRERKRWTPEHWASLSPFGIGHQRPNNYLELARAIKENAHDLGFAWRILTQGVCDGCALGTTGIRDWTLEGIHLCNIRLRLLRLNTMPAFNPALLQDVSKLANRPSAELRELGRIPYPMLREAGNKGFRRIGWDEALERAAARIRQSTPARLGFYLTSRGMSNECYYATQKAVRAMGSNNIDNAARVCHSPSTTALKETIGAAATTCTYRDWLASDLIVFIGSNVANNQPVATKYLHYAKKNGARIVSINNYREPGMEHYWIPSVVESALFGTKLTDQFFLVKLGGDRAFLQGVLKHLIEHQWLDDDFIREHTTGFEALKADLAAQSWDALEAACGLTRMDMLDLALQLAKSRKAVLVWSMGVAQHEQGVDAVRAIVNLALSRGFVGRDGCGLMPIRGHSGVQGGAEMGCYATAFPGTVPINAQNAAELGAHWGFPVPDTPGMTAPEMIDAAHQGALDVLWSVGGNFLEVLPEPDYVEEALSRVPLRVHMDIALTNQMFVIAQEAVLLLPATTRYEVPGGITQTSTERRIIFSPEIPGRRIGESRSEWEVFMELARRVKPELADRLTFSGTAAIREEIVRVVPAYEGIQRLVKQGDQIQYGGRLLCGGGKFDTFDGRARFSTISIPDRAASNGKFHLGTRRGKQFNSMVHEQKDAITGAGRDAIYINPADAERLGIKNGERISLRNDCGAYEGRAFFADIKPGSLQAHWPETNQLLDRARRSRESGCPDYNALVEIERHTNHP